MIYTHHIKGIQIYDATEQDVEDILFLIKEIAKYEKLEHEVIATKESLLDSIFIKKRAQVILVAYENKVIGYMLYFYNYSTFTGNANLYLEDLFILKEHRKKGIGKTLFQILAQKAVEEGCKRIDWVCLHWNEPSLNFYKSIGARRLDEWVVHRLEEKEIKKLANIEKTF